MSAIYKNINKNILKLIFILVVLGIGYKVVNYIQNKGNKEVVIKTPVVNENKVEGSYIPGGSNMLSFPKDTGSLIIYYGVVRKNSTSGEVRFRWYDIKTHKVLEPDNQYAWFWAMPINVPDDLALTDKWVKFIEGNRDSVFKITGTKGEDDCVYWQVGQKHCMENIDIKTIEVVGTTKSMEF